MNLNPQIFGFKIQPGQPQRVYFESSKIITTGLQGSTGFTIEGKTVTGVSIQSGLKTGHYLTMSANLSFWDNILVRYTGGSDLSDLDGNLMFNFRLQYIDNNMTEPLTSILKYVSKSGNDSNSGDTEGTAWRTMNYAAQNVSNDTLVMVEAGDYASENVVVANNGTADNPIKFIGYNNIGKNVNLVRSVGMTFDSTAMPLFKNGSGAGIRNDKNYVIFKNMQVDNYVDYGINYANAKFCIMDNIYVDNCKWSIRSIDWDSTNNRVINSYVANASQTGIEVFNNYNLIKNTWAVTSKVSSMDYYLTVRGGNDGHSNCVKDCYVNRLPTDTHSGHGISFRADKNLNNLSVKYSLVEDCQIFGTKLELRHKTSSFNVFRNTSLDGGDGIQVQDGASDNWLENVSVKNTLYFVQWRETVEGLDPDIPGARNTFANCTIENVSRFIETGVYLNTNTQAIKNNNFINCVMKDIPKMYVPNSSFNVDFDATNKFTNCIFDNCPSINNTKFKPTIQYSDLWNSFSYSGTNNIDVDPEFSPFPDATNNALNVGLWITDNEYDRYGTQRTKPNPTIGNAQINVEYNGEKSIITWTKSTDPTVFSTIIYRDDIKIGEVSVNLPSEFIDENPVPGADHKYEVQSSSPSGISIEEVTNVNVTNLSIPV